MFLSVFLFVIALSIDGLGVGISYGLRKIIIPWKSLIIISVSSALALGVSMAIGQILANFFSESIAALLGGLALALVGIWLIIQAWSQRLIAKVSSESSDENALTVFKINIAWLGLVIKILKEPSRADLDQSGTISTRESLFLGFALSMDSLGAGLGAAMMGSSLWLTPVLLALTQFSLLLIGLFLGKNFATDSLRRDLAFIPGLLILILGLMQILV